VIEGSDLLEPCFDLRLIASAAATRSPLREAMMTSAPWFAAASAVANPIPDDPPAITTRLFFKLIWVLSLSLS
jgi:hypothetical protein